MSVLIAGAGSIGTVVGTLLAENYDVTLLRRNVLNPTKIDSQIEGVISLTKRVMLTDIGFLKNNKFRFDIIYLAIQSQDTVNICNQLTSLIHPNTVLVSLQNGIRNGEIIRNLFPENPLILASIWWPATLLDETTVYYGRIGDTFIGLLKSDYSNEFYRLKLDEVYTQLNSIDNDYLRCKISENIEDIQLQKLVLNVIGPVAALVKKPVNQSLGFQEVRTLAHYLFDEALEIVKKEKTDLDIERLLGFHQYLNSEADDKSTRNYDEIESVSPGKTSTQISTEKYGGKRSNVDYLLGELENLGEKHNVEHQLISLVKSTIYSFEPNYSPLSRKDILEIVNSKKPDCVI